MNSQMQYNRGRDKKEIFESFPLLRSRECVSWEMECFSLEKIRSYFQRRRCFFQSVNWEICLGVRIHQFAKKIGEKSIAFFYVFDTAIFAVFQNNLDIIPPNQPSFFFENLASKGKNLLSSSFSRQAAKLGNGSQCVSSCTRTRGKEGRSGVQESGREKREREKKGREGGPGLFEVLQG